MNNLSSVQLAGYLGVTKRTVQRRAKREGWPFMVAKRLGGKSFMYAFETLPVTVKNHVIAQIIVKHRQQGETYSIDRVSTCSQNNTPLITPSSFIVANPIGNQDWLAQHIFAAQFPHPIDVLEQQKEYMRIGLLELAYLYLARFNLRKIHGFDEFCKLYNSRQLALKEEVYRVVSKVSRITLLRWEKLIQQSAKQHLIDGVKNKQVIFDQDLIQIAQELLMTTPNLTAKSLKQYFVTIFPERKIPHEKRLSAWLKQQKNS